MIQTEKGVGMEYFGQKLITVFLTLFICSALITGCSSKEDGASAIQKVSFVVADDDESTITYVFREYYIKGFADDVLLLESEYKDSVVEKEGKQVKAYCEKFVEIE